MPRVRLPTKVSDQHGFSVVEALLAIAVFGMLVTGLIGAIIYGRSSTASAGDRSRAVFLAEEGIEATRNIAAASYANLVDSGVTVGNTAIESGSDSNILGTSAYKVTTGPIGGSVSSVSVYLKTVDVVNQRVQTAIYADASGTPGVLLGASAIQTAAANTWNTFSMSGLTVAANTSYWIALSEDGATAYANVGSGGSMSYDLVGGYPVATPFIPSTTTADKASFYMTLSSTYGLVQTSNQWTLSGSSDTIGLYTRKITVASAGANRKTITSTVTWPQVGGTIGSVTVISQLANWQATIKLWTNAVLAGSADVAGTNNAVKTKTVGDYAYTILNATSNNFVITNVSNPAVPVNISTTTLAGTPTNIFVRDGYAYVTNSSNTAELQIVNISNPAAPTVAASVNLPGTSNGQGIFVKDGYAYVVRAADTTAGVDEMTVVAVTNPLLPTITGGYNNDIAMNEIYVAGNHAFIATSSPTQEMVVVNITTPAAPVFASAYNPSTSLAALTITGYGNTILLGMNTTLDAIDITVPTAPARLGTFTAGGTINGVDIDATNTYAFLGTTGTATEFQVVNISSPSSMTLAKSINLSGSSSTLGGVGYNTALDIVVGASAANASEVTVFTRG